MRVALWLLVACLLGVAACGGEDPAPPAPAPAAADWPMFRGNPERTGAPPGERGPRSSGRVWTYTPNESLYIYSSPTIVGQRLFIGAGRASPFDTSGRVICLDRESGRPLWTRRTAKSVFSSPSVVAGRLYIGEGLHEDSDCSLYCLDAATGGEIWTFATASHVESSPLVDQGRVYFGAGDDGVFCVRASDGRQLWHCPNLHVDAAPLLAGGRLLASTGYGHLGAFALDANDGSRLWFHATDLPVWGEPTPVTGPAGPAGEAGETRIIFGLGNGNYGQSAQAPAGAMICLRLADGSLVWRRDLPDTVVGATALAEGMLFLGCRDGRVYALDPADGRIAWQAETGGPVVASPAVAGGRLYVIGNDGLARQYAAATGEEIWAVPAVPAGVDPGELCSSPAIAGRRMYFGTGAGQVIAIGD